MRTRTVLFTLLAFLIIPAIMYAQEQETLAGNARVKGGFGGPFFLYSTVGERDGGGAGGGGGFIINNFFIGGYGQGETFGKIQIENEEYYLSIGSGGLWFGYVVPSHKLLHLFASMKVGWGGAVLTETDGDHDVDYDDAAFIMHPEVGLELNVVHWFRVAAQGGYRFMNGVNDIPTFTSDDFDSPTFSLVLRFGGFGYDKE